MKKEISFKLNGENVKVLVEPSETLLDVLRTKFGLFGAKETCGKGLCGTCTVIVSGKAVSSCLYFAPMADGEEVTTIEGLHVDGKLHPIQEAFYKEQGYQCGFCTPGMILMAKCLLDENPNPSDEEIKAYMSGNLCRCGSYPTVMKSIQAAVRIIDGLRSE